MTEQEVMELDLGIYVVFWQTGGCSVAAIGMTYDGHKWLAPANWTTSSKDAKFEAVHDQKSWDGVKGVMPILLTKHLPQPDWFPK